MRFAEVALVPLLAISAGAEVVYRCPDYEVMASCINRDSEGTLIELSTPCLEVLDSGLEEHRGSIFRVPGGGGLLAVVGAPDLPAIRRMVRVPERGEIELEIIDCESIALGAYSVSPYQQPPSWSGISGEFTIDREIYSSDELYPSAKATVETVQILRDMRIAWIRLNPVQVNPVSGEVVLNTSITLRVSAGSEMGENELRRIPSGVTRSFVPVYRRVLGWEADGDLVDGSYVFIGSQESIDEVADLIEWKRQKGYQVEIGYMSDIGTTSEDVDSWIESAYNDWPNPPEYVMLVGDESIVPSREQQYTGPYGPVWSVTDNDYGVVGSGTVPSIHVSRICGDSPDDLAYIAWKIAEHEMNPYEMVGESWFNYAVSMACTDFEAPEEAFYIHQLFMANALASTFYCDDLGGVPPSLSAFVDDINQGLSVISYIGHGNITSFVTTGFDVDDVAGLTNGRKTPWVYSVGCQNGQFSGYYCLMEAWLAEGSMLQPRGAVTCMGSTTYTPVGPGDSLQIYTFKGYFEEEIHHLGAAYSYAKNRIYQTYGGGADEMNRMGTVFGCPETDIYTDTSPISHLSNSHSSTIAPGAFQVTVLDDADGPVEGALVGLYYADEELTLASAYTDPSGVAELLVDSIPGPNEITVTSTAHNRAPAVTYVNTEGIRSRSGAVGPLSVELSITPNPVTGAASVEFSLPIAGHVEVAVYDMTGRKLETLCDTELSPGAHGFRWEPASAVANGVYFARLRTSAGEDAARLILTR